MQDVDGIPFLLQAGLYEIRDLLVVFDHQDAHLSAHGASPLIIPTSNRAPHP
jgi:hypothetical protein